MSTPAIEVEHLSKVYRRGLARAGVQALDQVDLRVEPGEVFGLLGPNGAGKTTLVKILLGVVRPTAGRAYLFGRAAARSAARVPVGFLPENHRFPDHLTAAQLLDLYGRLHRVEAETRRRRIPELLERVRMAKWRDTAIKRYSKGMMQRLGLAQALLSSPRLLLLDEPTDGVDPIGRRDIRDLLVWLSRQGTTIFLNSHLLSEVEQICERVAILHEGRVVRVGPLDEMTAVEGGYEVVATPLPPALIAQLDLRAAPEPCGEGLVRFRTGPLDRPALNACLDALRAAGVELETVRALRTSLEDYFIDLIEPTEPA